MRISAPITAASNQEVAMSDSIPVLETFDYFLEAFDQDDHPILEVNYNCGVQHVVEEPSAHGFNSEINPDSELDFRSDFDLYISADACTPSNSSTSQFTDHDHDPLTPLSQDQSPVPISEDLSGLDLGAPESLELMPSSLPSPYTFFDTQPVGLFYDPRWMDPAEEASVANMFPNVPISTFPAPFSPSLTTSPISPISPSSSECFSQATQSISSSRASSPKRTSIGPIRRRSRATKPANGERSYHCDFDGCDVKCRRPCDLTKHKKRHQKPFSCKYPDCESKGFSTAKDCERHELSKHRKQDHLVCCECGHPTARKDNMMDHVKRKHHALVIDTTMAIIAATAGAKRAACGEGLKEAMN